MQATRFHAAGNYKGITGDCLMLRIASRNETTFVTSSQACWFWGLGLEISALTPVCNFEVFWIP